jgi:transposase
VGLVAAEWHSGIEDVGALWIGFPMPRFKSYSYEQKVLVPVSLEEQLLEGTLEYGIHHLIEERVQEEWFQELYDNDLTGRRAYPPKLLLKVILFGYSRGLSSSRELERACRENVIFMALSCQEHPDHSTFAEFIGRLGDRLNRIFSEVLLVCQEEGLLGATHFALDGLKLPSNASREWSGKLADLRLKQQKLEEKIAEKLAEHRARDQGETVDDRGAAVEAPGKRLASIKRLTRKAERLATFLASAEPREGVRGELQSNVTDNDSARMYTGHGTVQGYNAQALVDAKAQIVVQAEASSDGQDYRQVEPMLAGAQDTLQLAGLEEAVKLEGAIFSADTSYHSEANLQACLAHGVHAFIPDTGFRQRDLRFKTQERYKERDKELASEKSGCFTVKDFCYEAKTDSYVCPAGQVLRLEAATARTPRGNEYRRYRARPQDCRACPLRAACLHTATARCRSLHLPKEGCVKTPQTLSQKMRVKIDSPEARQIYSQRLAIVEPVFANLRHNKGLSRFTYRTRKKVTTQWRLYCLVHNLEKLVHRGRTTGRPKSTR